MTQRLYFPFQRKTEGDGDRVIDDPIGNFSCLSITAKFLDIEKSAVPHLKTTKVKPTKVRTLNRADGSVVIRNPKNSSGIPAEYDKPGRLSKGTRSIILTTGKKIDARVRAGATYHTLSFRFPGFATILTIADALGTLIPANKIKSVPNATDISPYFRLAGGGRYAIMQKAAAQSSTEAQIALTIQQLQQLGGSDVSFIPGAGI